MQTSVKILIERERFGADPDFLSYVIRVTTSDKCVACGRGHAGTKCARIPANVGSRQEVASTLEQLAHYIRHDKTKTGVNVWAED